MMKKSTAGMFVRLASAGLFLAMIPGVALAAQPPDDAPHLVNGARETQAVRGSLAETAQAVAHRSEGAVWIGYGVEKIAGERSVCCGNYNDGEVCGTCRLESENRGFSTSSGNGPVKLEGGHRLVV